MKRFKLYANHGRGHGSTCTRKEFEPVVRSGLSYSPKDMAKLTERGMPVTGLNAGQMFYDGEENPSFDITTDRQRFVDVCDLWEQDKIIREKARAAYRASRQTKNDD